MAVSSGTKAALIGGLAVAALVGCAPSEPASTPAPAVVAAAQIPALEVRVDPPPRDLVEPTPPAIVATKSEPAPQTGNHPGAKTLATEPPATPSPTLDAPAVAYEPPFPNRTDLFVPPKRAGGAATGQSSGDNAVLLLGFVRVDQPKAVLSINGEIAPMAAGESRFGVDVISISPPNVVLQRGRQRWQTTLE
jgi:hypothetical protein